MKQIMKEILKSFNISKNKKDNEMKEVIMEAQRIIDKYKAA